MRLIDADALKDNLEHHYKYTDQEYEVDRQWSIGYNSGLDRALFSLNYAPTIETEPVRHGEWEFDPESYTWNCSECHDCEEDGCMDGSVLSNYCPNCGAKMDGAEREGSELNGGDALD